MPDPADWQATPEQIAADQRRDVTAAVTEMGAGASVLAVSEAVYLHPWVVVRRLNELGLTIPGMDWRPVKKERTASQKAASSFKPQPTQGH